MKLFLTLFFILNSFFALQSSVAVAADSLEALRTLPIQEGGRVKPFETFAKETLGLIYGKEKYEGRGAVEIVMTWILQPQAWEEKKFFEVRYQLLKKALKLEETRNHFSLAEILSSERLSYVMQELQSKREQKAKLDPYFQSLQRLESQIGTFKGVASGELIKLIPPKEGSRWLSLMELGMIPDGEKFQKAFSDISQVFVLHLGEVSGVAPNVDVKKELDAKVAAFSALAKEVNPALYPDEDKLRSEVHYSHFHPFQKAWIFYWLAVVIMILIWILKKEFLYKLSWLFALLGLGFHLYGFVLRIYLTGRAPVSNMYETVVWVALGAVVFSMIIEAIYKWRFVLLAGAIVGGFCLMLSDYAPVILDPSLQPLVAVLNSNFWLTTHVLTITISYAAFFLAFVLGDIALIFFMKGETEQNPKIRALTLSIYRAMQIGVGLLAPGIILGGIWADYSWGRFWGWDPKETWALIALLGYIAVLHARIAGLLRSYGIAVSAILTFSLVIMAWYGVNFILGAGLHSYGFGAGGVEYVASFVALHIIYVVVVSTIRNTQKSKASEI